MECRRHAELPYFTYLANAKIGDTYFCIATASANFNATDLFLRPTLASLLIERTKEKEGSLLPAGVNAHETKQRDLSWGIHTRVYRYISAISFWHPFLHYPQPVEKEEEEKKADQKKSREEGTSLDWRAGSDHRGTQRIE